MTTTRTSPSTANRRPLGNGSTAEEHQEYKEASAAATRGLAQTTASKLKAARVSPDTLIATVQPRTGIIATILRAARRTPTVMVPSPFWVLAGKVDRFPVKTPGGGLGGRLAPFGIAMGSDGALQRFEVDD